MQSYWIIVLFLLHVGGDITLSTEYSYENSAHCEVIREEDDERCGAICYPIVKPLLRYAAVCQGKDATINELKDHIREKDVSIAVLKSQLELAKSLEIQASKQVEDLREQSDARQKSCDQQLKDKETILQLKANEILKMETEMKDEISKMENKIQAIEAQFKSMDGSILEAEGSLKGF